MTGHVLSSGLGSLHRVVLYLASAGQVEIIVGSLTQIPF